MHAAILLSCSPDPAHAVRSAASEHHRMRLLLRGYRGEPQLSGREAARSARTRSPRFPGSAALERVADNCRAFCKIQPEPVLGLQLRRPDNPERTRRARAIELFPQHQPGVGQAVPLRLRSRSDLRRPDPVEVGDECSDPRRWCRDNPFVKFPDFHPPLTSHPRQAGGAGRLRRREPTPRPGGPPGP